MKRLLLLLGLLFSISGFAQKTYVPDDNFELYLEVYEMGDGVLGNDSVLTANINDITTLDVSGQGISDLTGIEGFTSLVFLDCESNDLNSLDVSTNVTLEYLSCWSNNLTSLDVSANVALVELYCGSNELTNLDVSSNVLLAELYCQGNALVSLNVSANIALEVLRCHSNQLVSLDVSANVALENFFCQDNLLTNLDVRNGNNVNMSEVYFGYNVNLYCINVDYVPWALVNWGNVIDEWTSFSENCETVLGCTDANACNYNPESSVDDGSCTYTDGVCETCEDGVIVDNDADNDGICDADEVVGCMDETACNYDALATDSGKCTHTDGICESCEDGIIVDNDADDDGICDEDEVVTYNCIANACVDPGDNSGVYSTLAACEAICNTTSVNEAELNDFTIYPNPAHTFITVPIKGEKVLYNSLGEAVLHTKAQQIDISHFSNGVYLVRRGNTYAKFIKE